MISSKGLANIANIFQPTHFLYLTILTIMHIIYQYLTQPYVVYDNVDVVF